MLRLDLTPAAPHTYLGPVPGAVGGSFTRAHGPGLGCQMSWILQETRVMGPPPHFLMSHGGPTPRAPSVSAADLRRLSFLIVAVVEFGVTAHLGLKPLVFFAPG